MESHSDYPNWPCPNNCMNWRRECDPHEPQTNHHPRCEYVDTSLIDVWRVHTSRDSGGCIVDDEARARAMASEDPDVLLEVTPLKMHREIYDSLREFNGF